MAQQREFLLYVGRNLKAAAQLHRMLVEILRAPVAQGRAPSQGADAPPSSDTSTTLPEERTSAQSDGHASSAPLVNSAAELLVPIEIVPTQKTALRLVQNIPARVIIVETGVKPASRYRFCDSLRQRLPTVRIVAIGPRSAAGLYHFAFDAVVSMPLRVADVLPIAEMIRFSAPDSVITRGPVTLNTLTRRVYSPRGEFEMTPKQCELLTMLMRQSDVVVQRAEIMHTIWRTSYLEDTRTLDVHVHWLRHMIETDPSQPKILVTRRGVGYQFVVPDTL